MHTASQDPLPPTTRTVVSTRSPVAKRTNRVRVWFGSHVIAEYVADLCEAEKYAVAIQRRFLGLRVTNEPLDGSAPGVEPLPAKHWWQVPPR
jgi:hypothetical protein